MDDLDPVYVEQMRQALRVIVSPEAAPRQEAQAYVENQRTLQGLAVLVHIIGLGPCWSLQINHTTIME